MTPRSLVLVFVAAIVVFKVLSVIVFSEIDDTDNVLSEIDDTDNIKIDDTDNVLSEMDGGGDDEPTEPKFHTANEDDSRIRIIYPKEHNKLLVDLGKVSCKGGIKTIGWNVDDSTNPHIELECGDKKFEKVESHTKEYDEVISGSHIDKIITNEIHPFCKFPELLQEFEYSYHNNSKGLKIDYKCAKPWRCIGRQCSNNDDKKKFNSYSKYSVEANRNFDPNENIYNGLDKTLDFDCLDSDKDCCLISGFKFLDLDDTKDTMATKYKTQVDRICVEHENRPWIRT